MTTIYRFDQDEYSGQAVALENVISVEGPFDAIATWSGPDGIRYAARGRSIPVWEEITREKHHHLATNYQPMSA